MNIKGLSSKEVQERIKEGKINFTNNNYTRSYKTIIYANIFTLFNGLNIILAILVIITKEYRNMLFMGTVITNTIIGIIQEIKAKKELDSLEIIIKPKIKALRDNKEIEININEIVLDDILILKAGDQIPVDSIILEGKLGVNEALISGEQEIITKTKNDELLSGSLVVSGQATTSTIAIGNDNYINKILNDIKIEKRQESKLRDAINYILKTVFFILIPLGIILFIQQFYFLKQDFNISIISSVASMIGMMPEGLVLLTSIALTIGMLKLAKRNTLVKEMFSLETLARCDILCLDKTGTLSTGKMHCLDFISHNKEDYNIIANIINITKDDNQTSLALKNYFKIEKELEITSYEAFSSEKKYSSITIDNNIYYLGAYDFINAKMDEHFISLIKQYQKEGYRILSLVKNNIVSSLIIIEDEIRNNAKETIAYLKSQDVKIKIISGDNLDSVINLLKKHQLDIDYNGIDCSKLKNAELMNYAQSHNIFARATPQDKKIIIDTLKKYQHTIGMIGDGVNDALALKQADFSIAMFSGAQSAKNIANVVLIDDDFSHIPEIIKEGRRVINNIKRTATLFLSKTLVSFLMTITTIIYLKKYPFIPIQLTFVSSLCIGIPSFLLSLEAKYERIKDNFLFDVFIKSFPNALIYTLNIIILKILNDYKIINENYLQTLAIFLLSAILIYTIYNISKPLSKLSLFVIFISLVGHIIIYLSFRDIFYLQLLDLKHFIILISLSLISIILLNIIKLFLTKKP